MFPARKRQLQMKADHSIQNREVSAQDRFAAWSQLNGASAWRWLIWELTKRGLGSELIVMVLGMPHAIETGRSFRLASRGWNLAARHIEALRRAFFVGAWSTNFGRMVALLKDLDTCAGVDGPFSVIVRPETGQKNRTIALPSGLMPDPLP